MLEENVNNNECEFSLVELGISLLKNSSTRRTQEKNLIIVGEKASGKSVLFNNILLNSSMKETYTPTCGINYSYMRYQPSSSKKLILNVYELGGGLSNFDLIKTILNNDNITNSVIIINLDLSIGNKTLLSLKEYLKKLTQILKESCSNDKLSEVIENKRFKYKDINSNDFKRVNIFPAEVIVLGNKYDLLEKIDYEKIKWTCRTLRFYCHINSLSLIYFKSSDAKLAKQINSLITSLAFNVNNENALLFSQKNDILPLYILYGADSLEEIGDPKVFVQGSSGSSFSRDPFLLWDETFASIYPSGENQIAENFDKNELEMKEKYTEARIDEELLNFE
jgi:hypothetical protein